MLFSRTASKQITRKAIPFGFLSRTGKRSHKHCAPTLLVSAIRAKDADLVKDTSFVACLIACSIFVPRRDLYVQVTLLKEKKRRLGNFSYWKHFFFSNLNHFFNLQQKEIELVTETAKGWRRIQINILSARYVRWFYNRWKQLNPSCWT
jgi:hypothetical protein